MKGNLKEKNQFSFANFATTSFAMIALIITLLQLFLKNLLALKIASIALLSAERFKASNSLTRDAKTLNLHSLSAS